MKKNKSKEVRIMKIKISDKIKKMLITLVLIVLCISLSINVIILKEKPCFGAINIWDFNYAEKEDAIVVTFGGHEYAVLDDSSRYDLSLSTKHPLTKLYTGGYLRSVLDTHNERTVYGLEDDPNNLFLTCDYYDELTVRYAGYSVFGPPSDTEVYLYRTDYEIPELSPENVESIEFYAYEENGENDEIIYENDEIIKVFFETDKKNIKKWIDNYDILMTEEDFGNNGTDKTVYYVYAKFNDVCLRYDLGNFALDDFEISEFSPENVEAIDFYTYDENSDEIKVYSETDEKSIEKWLINYKGFESTDSDDYKYGIHQKGVYRVCAKSVDADLSYFLGCFKIDDFENNKFPEQKQP